MAAVQRPNVDVHFTAADSITSDGVVGSDGIERKCDTIVCATGDVSSSILKHALTSPGFDVGFRPRFPVIGKNGVRTKYFKL